MSDENKSSTTAETVPHEVKDVAPGKAGNLTGAPKWIVSGVLLLVIGGTIFYIVQNLGAPAFTGEVQSITQPQVRPKTAP